MNTPGWTAIATLIAVCVLSLVSVVAQQAAAPAPAFRTAWGDPDLQGIWSGETLTPLQRPARLAGKPVMTPEEAAKAIADIEARPGREDRSFRGTEKDVAAAYNQIFVQRASEFSDYRT